MNRDTDLRIQTVCIAILTIFTIFGVLKVLSGILVPFTMAVFLTLVLIPIVEFFMQRLRIRRIFALILTLFIGTMMILGTSVIITGSIRDFSSNLDSYEQQLKKLVDRAEEALPIEWIMSLTETPEQSETSPTPTEPSADATAAPEEPQPPASSETPSGEPIQSTPEEAQPELESTDAPPKDKTPLELSSLIPKGSIKNFLQLIINSTLSIIGQTVLVLMFTAFLLAGSTTRKKRPKGSAIAEIEVRVQKYIGLKVIISLMTGALVYLVLAVLGVDYALTFGVFTFILNFIPNVGSFIAVALPLPVVMLDPEISFAVAVLAIALPFCVQIAIGNFVEPKVMGDTLGLHPVMVLMSLILWSFLWGFPGALLAVPMTSIAKIIFERIELTKPVALVMEGNLDSFDKS